MTTDTEQQLAIYDNIATGAGHTLVVARAGTGKTTTIERSLAYVPSDLRCLFVAFNKSVADELRRRISLPNVTIGTCHSFGLSAITSSCGMVEVDQDRALKVINRLTNNRSERFAVLKAVGLAKGLLIETVDEVVDACDEFGIEMGDWPERFAGLVVETMRRTADLDGTVDYNDMIWLPVRHPDIEVPKFDRVFVDEVQDLNASQVRLVQMALKPGGRICAIGDEKQCHPPGTLIAMTGGQYTPVEQVTEGSQVVSYHDCFRGLMSQGRAVEAVAARRYVGPMLTLRVGNSTVQVTPNHRVPTRLPTSATYALYLMECAGVFRIGVCKTSYKHAFGPAMRARQEGAEKLWVLETFTDPTLAKVCETVLSLRYGILEQARFLEKGSMAGPLLAAVKHLPRPNVGALLAEFGRDYGYPLWEAAAGDRIGRYIYVTEACNLLNGVNTLRTFDGTQTGGEWAPVRVSTVVYDGLVYSLKVAPTEGGLRLYVAANVLVHNSIYRFRGADKNAINGFRAALKATELPLTTSFRCARAIIKEAQRFVPDIQARPDAPEGSVTSDTYGNLLEKVEYGDFVLSRTNAPLLRTALQLLKTDCRVSVLGREFGTGLVSLVYKLRPATPQHLVINARAWLSKEEQRLMKKDPPDESGAELARDKFECIEALAATTSTIEHFVAKLKHLFEPAGAGACVTLSTTHKAKGLERDKVWVLADTYLRPRKGIISQEEKNLYYVAVTRAKNSLVLVHGLPGAKS